LTVKVLVAATDTVLGDFLWNWLGDEEGVVLSRSKRAVSAAPDGSTGWVVALGGNDLGMATLLEEQNWVERILVASVGPVESPLPHSWVVVELPTNSEKLDDALERIRGVVSEPTGEFTAEVAKNAPVVLVVEDSESQRRMVVGTLKGEGFRVLEAGNGRLGLEVLRRQAVDVMITDVEMPEMDGLTLTRSVRSDPKLSRLPILMTTTLSAFKQVREGFDAGASDYVVKPQKGEREAYLEEIVRRVYAFLETARVVEGKRALAVDDSPAIRQMVAGILRDNGFDVTTASDGQLAQEILDQDWASFDVVVTDLEMPQMDGLQLTHWVKRDERMRDLPVIILSGSTQGIHRSLGRGFGADAFLTKTLIEEKLLLTIELVTARNRMAREHRELSRILGRDVFRAVHGGGLEAKEQDVSILFSDIVGFSTLCTRKSAGQVVEMLNDYFDVMVDCIAREQGYVNKFIGDAIMAIFSPQPGLELPPLRAVRAGLAMQAAYKKRNSQRAEPIITRVGINTGRVILGLIGGGERKDYTVIGDEVNRAQRFEGKCTPGGVLVSQSTWEVASSVVGQMENVEVARVNDLALKGIATPVTAWSLMPKEGQ